MRNRDGNNSLLWHFCTLALPLFLQADVYLIGYKATVVNTLLVDEVLSVSRSMKPCQGILDNSLVLTRLHNEGIQELIIQNREKFDEYIRQFSLHVSAYDKTINNINQSLTTLSFPTHCFKVDFKGNLAKITLIK